MKFSDWMDSIDPLDSFGFQVRPHLHWLPESRADELNRLEMNLSIFRETIKNGHRFPDKIVVDRRKDHARLQQLRSAF